MRQATGGIDSNWLRLMITGSPADLAALVGLAMELPRRGLGARVSLMWTEALRALVCLLPMIGGAAQRGGDNVTAMGKA
jgi:hypothetical protein